MGCATSSASPIARPSRVGISIGDSLAGGACLHGHAGGAPSPRAHRRGPGRRCGDLRVRAQHDGVAGHGVRSAGPRARTQRRDPAAHRALERLSDARWHRDDRREPGHRVRAAVRGDGNRPRSPTTRVTRDHQARGAHQRELDEIIARMDRDARHARAARRCSRSTACPRDSSTARPTCSTIRTSSAREAIVSTAHPRFGTLRMQNVAPRLSVSPSSIRTPAPELGQHNDGDLSGVAGPRRRGARRLSRERRDLTSANEKGRTFRVRPSLSFLAETDSGVRAARAWRCAPSSDPASRCGTPWRPRPCCCCAGSAMPSSMLASSTALGFHRRRPGDTALRDATLERLDSLGGVAVAQVLRRRPSRRHRPSASRAPRRLLRRAPLSRPPLRSWPW